MVNRCYAVGCTSCSDQGNDVTFHKFPLDHDLLEEWLRRLSRLDFQPTSNSRLCSKPFASHDFIETRQDSNSSRKRAKGALELRYLKPNAVPSIFPDYPSYMSRETVPPRSMATSSSSRYEAMTSRLEQQNDEFLTANSLNDLADLNNQSATIL